LSLLLNVPKRQLLALPTLLQNLPERHIILFRFIEEAARGQYIEEALFVKRLNPCQASIFNDITLFA
jgi:hypothetical protein